MTQTIRFYSIDPDTVLDQYAEVEDGLVWRHDDGRLEYQNDVVRDMMAPTVSRFGEEAAFERFSNWSNGWGVCSHLVQT